MPTSITSSSAARCRPARVVGAAAAIGRAAAAAAVGRAGDGRPAADTTEVQGEAEEADEEQRPRVESVPTVDVEQVEQQGEREDRGRDEREHGNS